MTRSVCKLPTQLCSSLHAAHYAHLQSSRNSHNVGTVDQVHCICHSATRQLNFLQDAQLPRLTESLHRHGKNLNSDGWKALQLWRHTCNPAHPCHRFSTGNKDTLLTQPKARGINSHLRVSHSHMLDSAFVRLCLSERSQRCCIIVQGKDRDLRWRAGLVY